MSIRDLYPSKSNYLKAEDLKGNSFKLKIEKAEAVKFDNGMKLVLSFVGREKRLSLNKTNARIIADRFGDEEGEWIGKEIEIYAGKTTYQNKLVDCISVRVPAPAAFDDDIPF